LVRRGRIEDAKKALRRLTSSKNADESFNIDDTVAMIVTTNELEKSLESGVGYLDCFKGNLYMQSGISMNFSMHTLLFKIFHMNLLTLRL
jgi:hypothetical protein